MAAEKFQVLLQRLIASTRSGDVVWKKSSEAPESFEYVNSADDKVIIDSRDDDAVPPYDLLVFAPDGTKIGDLLWTGDATTAQTQNDLLLLYELARDRASGTSEVLDRLIQELPNPDDIPF
jgi:hypothetical protein